MHVHNNSNKTRISMIFILYDIQNIMYLACSLLSSIEFSGDLLTYNMDAMTLLKGRLGVKLQVPVQEEFYCTWQYHL